MFLSPKNELSSFSNFVSILPQELLCAIFKDIPFKERIACMGVCKVWYSVLANCQSLWSTLSVNRADQHHFGILRKAMWQHALQVNLSRLAQSTTHQLLRLPSPLRSFERLRSFKLEHCAAERMLLFSALSRMSRLESLSIHYCRHDKVIFAADLLALCPDLHALSHCTTQRSAKRIQDNELRECNHLTSLTIIHEETQEPCGFYPMITKILQRSPRLRNIYFRFRLDPEIYQSIIESCPQLDRLEVRDSLSDRFSATWTPYYDGKGHDASSDDSTFRSVSCTVRCHGHIQLEQFISSFVASQLFSIKSLRIGLFSNTILTPFSRLDSILRQDTDNRNQITDLVFEGLPANAAGYVASIVCRTPLLRSLTIIRSSSMLSSTPAVFTALSSRIHLEALSIKACRIHNTGLYDLLEHHRRNIKTIVLECISGIDDRTLWIIASLPGLQTLSLCNVAGVTEDDMQECIKRLGLLSTLKEVRLQGRSRELTPQLAHAIASIKGIEVISMDHIGCTTIETVHRMFEQSHTLKTVHIIQNAGSRCRHETLKRNA